MTDHLPAQAQDRRARFLRKLQRQPATSTNGLTSQPRDPAGSPLSDGQKRMWFFAQLDSESSAYNMPVALRLRGALDVTAMTAALLALTERHEILRTVFFAQDGEPRQRVVEVDPLAVSYVVIDQAFDDALDAERLPASIREFVDLRFDLSRSAFRAAIFKLADDDHMMVLVIHHLVSDGWSLGIIERELDALYDALRRGDAPALPTLSLQYIDYAIWRGQAANAVRHQRQCEFWQAELADAPPLLQWPGDRPRPAAPTHAGASLEFRVPSDLAARLARWAQQRNASLYVVLLAVFDVFVSKVCGVDDLVIGTPVANRQRSQLEDLVGFFANTVALRAHVDGERSLSNLIETLKLTMARAFSNQDVPFEQVVEHLGIVRSANTPPVVQTLFVLQSGPSAVLGNSGLRVDRIGLGRASVEFDLIIEMLQTPDGIEGIATYSTELFDSATIARMLRCYVGFLETAIDAPDLPIAQLRLAEMSPQAVSETDFSTQTVHSSASWLARVGVHVAKTPDAVAVREDGRSITYAELWRNAHAAAAELRARFGLARPRVGLIWRGLEEFATATLAVALVGGEWIDLDSSTPMAVWARAWSDDAPDLVLAADDLALPFTGLRMSFARLVESGLARADAMVVFEDVADSIIYRRRALGRDYAVRASALQTHLDSMDVRYGAAPCRIVWWPGTAAGGGNHVSELLWCLSAGACINADVAIVDSTTDTALALVSHASIDALQRLVEAGACIDILLWRGQSPDSGVHAWLRAQALRLHVLHTLPHIEGAIAIECDTAGIAQTVAGAQIRDRHGNPAIAGAYGELWLPTARFAQSDGDTDSGPAAMHRDTGLRVRLREDGRIDTLQWPRDCVWIEGEAFDLDLIERTVSTLDQVRECRVLPRADAEGRTRLVAHIAADRGQALAQVVDALAEILPEVAVRIALVEMMALPHTSAGRINDAALSQMPATDPALEAACRAALLGHPDVRDTAVLTRWDARAFAPWHLSDLIPGWTRQRQPSAPVELDIDASADTVRTEDIPSIRHGAPLPADAIADANLGQVLVRIAAHYPDHGVRYIDGRGDETCQSYADLAEEASRILAGLRACGVRPGDRVFMQLPRNRDIVPTFWACALGGFVAVPLGCGGGYEIDSAENTKFANAWRMLGAACVVTERALGDKLEGFARRHDLNDFTAHSIETLRAHAPDHAPNPTPGDDIALLLLTSGSTGLPKAVTQTHGALIARSAATRLMNGFTPLDVSLNWMPLDHVGGLVMFHLLDLFVGCQQLQVDTSWILQEPLRWLDLVERHRASVTWAPNFAYALINDEVERQPQRSWDLSSLRFILNGGEAVVPATARRFLSCLAPHGLPGTAMKPAWGMSETCSGVTFNHGFRFDTADDEASFTVVGNPIPGFSVRIVDAEDRAVPQGRSGRLQVMGPSVTRGYFNNPEINAEAFTRDGWFCTGDLGVMRNDGLTINGREKDLIIINGVNYYGHELEKSVDDSGLAQTSYTAACAVRLPGENTDRLAVFFCSAGAPEQWSETLRQIRLRLLRTSGVSPDYLVPVAREDIPKTAIGKIQRSRLADQLMAGAFDATLRRVDLLLGNEHTIPAWFHRPVWRALPSSGLITALRGARVLVFAGQAHAGELYARLHAAGAEVVQVAASDGFVQVDDHQYRIAPLSHEDWSRLFDALLACGRAPTHLLYLGFYDVESTAEFDGDSLMQTQAGRVYALIALSQALKRAVGLAPLAVRVLANGTCTVHGQDALDPAKATLAGLIRTADQEHPQVDWRLIDAGDLRLDDSRHWMRELADAMPETVVAYRRQSRFVPRLVMTVPDEKPAQSALSPEGRYVVTGGLGGVGRRVCFAMLRNAQTHLLILGRTPLSEIDIEDGADAAQQRELIALCREDRQVRYRTIDIRDRDGLESCVQETQIAWGAPMSGAIHIAGVFEERQLDAETPESWQRLLAPKLLGAWNLHHALRHVPDALFVHFSSVNGRFGGTGVGAYAAASSFLDQFCAWQNARGKRSYSLGFSMWDELGMSRGYAMKELTRRRGFHTMAAEQAVYSLLAILSRAPGHHFIGLDANNRQIQSICEPASVMAPTLLAFLECDSDAIAADAVAGRCFDGAFMHGVRCEPIATPVLPRDDFGTIDWSRLIQTSTISAAGAHETAQTWQSDIERELADVWHEVLGARRVSRSDNFFESGGNSLLVSQVISRIRKRWGAELSIHELFEAPTIAQLAERIDAMRETATAQLPLEPMPRDRPVPLALAQQRLWLLDQLEGPSATYNMPSALRLRGKLDVAALERSFETLQQRHEILRTTFVRDGEQVSQVVEPILTLPVRHLELSSIPADARESRMLQLARDEAALPFSLTTQPAFRVTLVRLTNDEHVLFTTMHHIVSDAWSIGVMVREFVQLYGAYRRGIEPEIAVLPVQYADFTLWQRQWLTPDDIAGQLDYWRQTLQGLPPLLQLPTDFPRPAMQSYRGASITSRLPQSVVMRLEALAAREGCSLYMTLLASFQWLLSRYSGQTDIAVGASVANRNRPELESMIGFFANTLVMRTQIDPQARFSDLLATVKANTLSAYAHQDVPFDQVVEAVQPERSLAHSPLFQVLFVLLDTAGDDFQLPDVDLSPVEAGMVATHFDLSVHVHRTENGADCHFMYNTDLFAPETIQRMLAHWQTLVASVSENPQRSLARLPFLSDAERTRTMAPIRHDDMRNVAECFEARVAAHPEAIALRSSDHTLSYAALNADANRLAHVLRAKGVTRGALVALCLPRSADMAIAILATLKIGGVYVALDPDYPEQRLRDMLCQSAPAVLVTHDGLLAAEVGGAVVIDRMQWPELFDAQSDENPAERVTRDENAYLIFTSGSTGQPKGILCTHGNLVHYADAMASVLDLRAADRWLHTASFSFSSSVRQLIVPLLNGACVVIADRAEILDPLRLLVRMQRDQVTIVDLVPSYWRSLIDMLKSLPESERNAVLRNHLRLLLAASEPLSADIPRTWRALAGPSARFFNMYGQTETCGIVALGEVHEDVETATIPIGEPIPRVALYVLDPQGLPCPTGAPGELFVAGDSVAAGYLGAPELTAACFLPNTFAAQPRALHYATGDRARVLADGRIELLGRADSQIKIRGFRVELADIESAARALAFVKDCTVSIRGDGASLALYILGDGVATIDPSDIRQQLRRRLPDYMVPADVVVLDALPRLPNGKIDVRALPDPVAMHKKVDATDKRDLTHHERLVMALWSELLGGREINLHDNFFDVGGHSLLVIQSCVRLQQHGLALMPMDVFQYPTIACLAGFLDERSAPQPPAVFEAPQADADARSQKQRDALLRQRQMRRDRKTGGVV